MERDARLGDDDVVDGVGWLTDEDVLGLSVMSKSSRSAEPEKDMSMEGSSLTLALSSWPKPVGRVKPRSISLSHVPPISSRGIASEECCIVGGLRVTLRDKEGGGGPAEEFEGAEKG